MFYKNTSIFINIPVCSGATLQRMAKQSHSSPPCPLKKAQKINFLNHYTDFVMALITMTSGSYARLWFWHWLYYETLIQKRNVLMNISEKDQLCSWLGFSWISHVCCWKAFFWKGGWVTFMWNEILFVCWITCEIFTIIWNGIQRSIAPMQS